jgi:hypothetical protein
MIALFFLNVTVLLIIGILALMLRSSQKLVDYSSGTIVAGEVMDYYIYNTSSIAPGTISGEVDAEAKHFEYKIDVITVLPHLHKIDVKIFWWDSSADYREGYGKMYTSISTLQREQEVAPSPTP